MPCNLTRLHSDHLNPHNCIKHLTKLMKKSTIDIIKDTNLVVSSMHRILLTNFNVFAENSYEGAIDSVTVEFWIFYCS